LKLPRLITPEMAQLRKILNQRTSPNPSTPNSEPGLSTEVRTVVLKDFMKNLQYCLITGTLLAGLLTNINVASGAQKIVERCDGG
jgi:tetrahydromethanopterin S-methyltransferase subunit E